MTNAALREKPDAGNPRCNSNSILKLVLGVATLWTFAAGAEVICYNGFSTSPNTDLRSRVGFTSDSNVPVPSGVGTYVMLPQNSSNAATKTPIQIFRFIFSLLFIRLHRHGARIEPPHRHITNFTISSQDNCKSRQVINPLLGFKVA